MSVGEDDDLDLAAAEYVIGTLDPDERAAFAARLATEPRAKASVVAWERRCSGLADGTPALDPPPQVWEKIERALAGKTATMHPFKVIPGGLNAEASTLRGSRDRWRIGALLSGAIAAALAVFVVDRTYRAPPEAATYIAAVNRGGDKPALIVRVDLKTGQVLVRTVAAETPPGHSLELWYIGTDKTPRSMGVIPADAQNVSLPTSERSDAAIFAVTLEPPGGSKTGGPTGPVVYKGQLIPE